MKSRLVGMAILAVSLGVAACSATTSTSSTPTAEDAKAFLNNVDTTLKKISVESNQAGWVAQNFITADTEALDARMTQVLADSIARWAKESVKFDALTLPADERRQLNVLKLSLTLATPADPRRSRDWCRRCAPPTARGSSARIRRSRRPA